MRLAIALCLAGLLLAGCASQATVSPAPSIDPEIAASIEESSGVQIPSHVDALAGSDAEGRTPDEAVLALIDVANGGRWDTLYSMYATPTPDLDSATREWAEARETYEGFRVLEVRVVAPDAAFVRVAYKVTTAPMGASAYSAEVQQPGEWWPLHKVDGVWKVQWMPRQ